MQLTIPSDTPVDAKDLDEFISSIDSAYQNPEFLVSILAKLSRKLSEPNIFTKLKVWISLHVLVDELTSEKAKYATLQCFKSLRSEHDGKVGHEFYSLSAVESFSLLASTVGELEGLELTRAYGLYVSTYLESLASHLSSTLKKKVSINDNKVDIVERLLSLLDHSEDVDEICKKSSVALSKQCLEHVKRDRVWILKQLSKHYEVDNI